MKDKEHAELASLAQTRDKLVKLRTTLKNKINNILSAHGINLKKEVLSTEKGLNEVLGMMLGDVVDVELRVLVEQIRSLNQSISELERTMRKQGLKLPGYKNLKSIKGIGDTGASVLLSVIGDVNDFADVGKLASYFGIVPRVSNSNETQRSGRITSGAVSSAGPRWYSVRSLPCATAPICATTTNASRLDAAPEKPSSPWPASSSGSST